MEVPFTPDELSRIYQLAAHTGQGAGQFVRETVAGLLDDLHERDEWLAANRQAVNEKIRQGIEELERGEGIPESELDEHLERLKAQPE